MPGRQNAEVPEIVEIMEIEGSVEPQKTLVKERQGDTMKLTLGFQSVEAVMMIHQLSSL